MAEQVVLETKQRDGRGSHAARQLRKNGEVPGVIYGHKEETVPISLAVDALQAIIRHGTRVVDLKTTKGLETALIQEVQWDHLGKEVLHVDFRRTSKDERIVVPVVIELRGIAPGVTAGGILNQPLHTLEVECLAISIPESIRVNIAELQIGSVIHVRELKVPEGVKIMVDPDAIVVQIAAPQAEAEAPAAEAGGPAEPEIVGRRVAAEEEGAE
jgi:large subunit ribosomal protein L25